MPADYWGYIDPQREELRNALLRAQIQQTETQTRLAEELGAQGQVGAGAGVGGAIEDDSLQWEQLEFQKEQLKEQTELAKAQQLILERQMTLKEEAAEAPVQMGLDEMLLSAAGEPMVTPGQRIGGAMVNPLTGEPMYQEPIVAGLEETVLRPGEEGVMKAPQVKIGPGTLIDAAGNTIYSEPEIVESGAEVLVINRADGSTINRMDIAQVPQGFEPTIDTKGNLYVTNLDTGQSELAQPSAYYEMEYEQEDRRIKVAQFGHEVQSKGYDVAEYGYDVEKYVADKAYDRVIDVELIKQDIQDSANLTEIEKQQLINKAEALKVEATDRRTEAMLVGYDVEKYGHDIKRYIADVGYDETVDAKYIERDIQNSKNATDKEKQDLIYELGVLTNESKERMSKATIEAGDRKLVTDRYVKGYVPQSAEEAIAYVEHKAQIEAKYDPFTTPNMMNEPDAKQWLEDKAAIDLFVTEGETTQKIRFELIKARAAKSPEDLLKESAIQMMPITEAGELGRALLEVPITEAGVKEEQVRLRGEELELKREGDALGIAKDEQDLLRDMMLRATATHKPTYGVYGEREKVMAANTLLELIRLDETLRPETKMQYLEAVPSLTGVSLAEELRAGDRPYFDWFRGMMNEALNELEAETGLPRPGEKFKGVSIEEIIREVERIFGETGSRKKVAKYLKKYGLDLDKYREASQAWLTR